MLIRFRLLGEPTDESRAYHDEEDLATSAAQTFGMPDSPVYSADGRLYEGEHFIRNIYDDPAMPIIDIYFNTIDWTPKTEAARLWLLVNLPPSAELIE